MEYGAFCEGIFSSGLFPCASETISISLLALSGNGWGEKMELAVAELTDYIHQAKSTQIGAILLSQVSLRILLWVTSIAFVIVSYLISEKYAQKIPGTKNNTAHGDTLHRERIRAYFFRRSVAVVMGVVIPGVFVGSMLLWPSMFFSESQVTSLQWASNNNGSPVLLVPIFIADQILKGALSDFGEIFGLGLSQYTLVLESTSIKILVAAYRLLLNIYGLAAIYLLGRVIIDRLLIKIQIGSKDDGRPLHVNLSGLARGGIWSGYVDDTTRLDVREV